MMCSSAALYFVALLIAAFGSANAENCAWENCPKWSAAPNAINVHLVTHTHDDMGWIKSADDYYTGAKRHLVPVGVQFILNTVIDELNKNPDRRFSYAETGFLYRWLSDHDQKQRDSLHKLITETGQLELIGGGWTQPDEATTHYVDLVDQYTLGLGTLNATYGRCGRPKMAWQIDPFGHSREHANLAALMGYQALFFARMHYAELARRAKARELEMVWSASDELKTNILTGGFLRGTYAPPEDLCFDALCGDDPIIDNPMFEGFNLEAKLDRFFNTILAQASTQRHGHVLLTMGGDFQYSNANTWFTQLDKLIAAVSARSASTNISAFYSTPGCYLAAVEAAQPQLPAKSGGDFFPYATSNHSYWTGYFTSKPALKGLIRASSALLQLSRQFAAFSLPGVTPRLEQLERAQALCTHHDAVTGTSKENVTRDYERRLLAGWEGAESALNLSFWRLSMRASNSSQGAVPPLQFCRLSNESVCDATKSLLNFSLVLFNSGSAPLDTLVRVPFHRKGAQVYDDGAKEIEAQLVKPFFLTHRNSIHADSAPFELLFRAQIPALGFRTYFVLGSAQKRVGGQSFRGKYAQRKARLLEAMAGEGRVGGKGKKEQNDTTTVTISNDFFRLQFGADGLLSSVQDLRRNRTVGLSQRFLFYRGMSDGQPDNRTQASGAYIFRPDGSEANKFPGTVQLQIINNSLVQEVRQLVCPFVAQSIRLVPGKPLIEFDFTVGPLPKNKSALQTTEVISRYALNGMQSKGAFWTDANGRQMLQRKRNDASFFEGTEPAAGNYYPVNSRILAEDGADRMVLLTDRSQGGASLADGQIELMLHRRAFWDDGWGVEEALDEPGQDGQGLVVRGRHWLLLGDPGSAQHRSLAMEMFRTGAPQMAAFAPFDGNVTGYAEKFNTKFSALSGALPPNVHVLSLRALSAHQLLLRLEHFYQQNENSPVPGVPSPVPLSQPTMAEPVEVDIQKLFLPFTVLSVDELSLAANVPVEGAGPRRGPGGMVVQMRPMEIRTFHVRVHYK